MIVLLGIGFLAGLVTALSPCVLPVLPILLAGGATGRKPLRIVTGLVASFVVFTLFAAWLLDPLGLPEDLLRNLAIAMLFLVAATLLVPRLALCSSGRSRGSRASARAAAASCSASRSGSCSCRAQARCWRRSRSSRRTTTSASGRPADDSPTRSAPPCRCC